MLLLHGVSPYSKAGVFELWIQWILWSIFKWWLRKILFHVVLRNNSGERYGSEGGGVLEGEPSWFDVYVEEISRLQDKSKH